MPAFREVLTKEGPVFNVKAYGATGDGTTDDTAAIQTALDLVSSGDVVYVPSGTYLVDNISFPNVSFRLVGGSIRGATIKSVSTPTDSSYLAACSTWVDNSASVNNPIYIENIQFTAGTEVDHVLVLRSFSSLLDGVRVNGGNVASLLLTADSNNGTPPSSTAVENRLANCELRNTVGGDAFQTIDSNGNKLTDWRIVNTIFNGPVSSDHMGGATLLGCQFYGGVAGFTRLGQGTRVANNYFGSQVSIGNFLEEVVSWDSNVHKGADLTVSFGASGKVCVLEGCTFQVNARVKHDYFAPDKHLVVNGGAYDYAGDLVYWHNGSSTGLVSLNRVFSYDADSFYSGRRNALSGDFLTDNVGTSTPAEITSDQNDYAPSEQPVWRLSSDASRTITGIGTRQERITIINVGSNDIVLAHDNVSSSNGNRIISPTGANVTIASGENRTLIRDTTSVRWRILS